jgi:hypothetical protein
MRLVLAGLLACLGCGDGGSSPDAGPTEDAPPPHCPVFGVTVGGDAYPGGTLTLAVSDDGSAPFTLQWSVTDGEIVPGDPAVWTFPDDFGAIEEETATWTLTIGGAGCTSLSGDVTVGWPDRLRTVVLYNPAVAGSEDVARHYATGHGIPEAHLCGVVASN